MSEYIMSHTGAQLDEAISKVLSGYIAAQYGLTEARRITFDVSSANGESTEASPLLSWTPEVVPKLIIFGLTANVSNNTSAVSYSSSYNTLLMSFWIDSSCFPIGTSNNAGRKKCAYLATNGNVNVSNNNLGFEYSANTGKIFLKQASGCRISPKSATDGYYEILYWG